MRRKPREISIFNLSMMDVIFGALGAFMLLFLIVVLDLSPPTPAPHPCPTCDPCPQLPPRPQCPVCVCKKDSFFVFWIGWDSPDPRTDIDLYVIAPNGEFCGFSRKSTTQPEMNLIFDYQSPGRGSKEMVLVPQAGAGRWKIAYHHYNGAPARVQGSLRGSGGVKHLIRTRQISAATHGIRRENSQWSGHIVFSFEIDRDGRFLHFQEVTE